MRWALRELRINATEPRRDEEASSPSYCRPPMMIRPACDGLMLCAIGATLAVVPTLVHCDERRSKRRVPLMAESDAYASPRGDGP